MADADELRWTSLEEVLKAARAFLQPVLAGDQITRWGFERWRWE
jgi:hypothetical protein